MKAGDTIRVARQPLDQWVRIVGEVGRIDEIQGDRASIDVLNVTAQRHTGSGSAPLDCLEPYRHPLLDAAIAKREAELKACLASCEQRRKKWKELVAKVASEHGVAEKVAEAIMDAGRDFD